MKYLLGWQQVGHNWPLCFKRSRSQNRKATMSFVMCNSPSVRMGQLGSHWKDFHEIWRLHVFQKSVEKIRGALKSDKNNNILYEAFYICTFMTVSRWKIFQTKVAEKNKTRGLSSIYFSRKSSRLWRTVEKYGTARQATDYTVIWLMRFECWLPKAADTHSE